MIFSIGKQLRARREQMNLTLRDVAQRTRIPARALGCLEEADYMRIGGITYACSGLRSYSRCLGMDVGDEIAMLKQTVSDKPEVGVHGGELPYDLWGGNAPTPKSARTTSLIAAVQMFAIFIMGGASYWMHQSDGQWVKARAPTTVSLVQDVIPQPLWLVLSPPSQKSNSWKGSGDSYCKIPVFSHLEPTPGQSP